MRSSSGNRKIRGYEPRNPVRNESNRTHPTGVRRDSGMGWDGMGRRGKEGDMPAWSERRADLFDFCAKHLPEEHAGFCVTAAIAVQMTGRKLTKNAILERLRDTDRTAEQLRSKGWLE